MSVYVKHMLLDIPGHVSEVQVFADTEMSAANELAKTLQLHAGASEVYWASNVAAGVVAFVGQRP